MLVWTAAYLLPDWADPYLLTELQVSRGAVDGDGDGQRSLDDYRQRIAHLLGVSRYCSCEKP